MIGDKGPEPGESATSTRRAFIVGVKGDDRRGGATLRLPKISTRRALSTLTYSREPPDPHVPAASNSVFVSTIRAASSGGSRVRRGPSRPLRPVLARGRPYGSAPSHQ